MDLLFTSVNYWPRPTELSKYQIFIMKGRRFFKAPLMVRGPLAWALQACV